MNETATSMGSGSEHNGIMINVEFARHEHEVKSPNICLNNLGMCVSLLRRMLPGICSHRWWLAKRGKAILLAALHGSGGPRAKENKQHETSE